MALPTFLSAFVGQISRGPASGHGAPRRLLLEQTYPGEDDEKLHFDFLARAFQDPRYMTVSGCPIFLIYAPHELPDPVGLTKRWKRMALERDFRGLHLIAMSNDINHPSLTCFDQVMPFGPGDYLLRKPMSSLQRIVRRLAASPTGEFLGGNLRVLLKAPMRFDYEDVVDEAFASLPSASRYLPCVLSGWDNTPRSGRRGIVFNDCEPELFRLYVRKAVEFVKHRAPEERLVFIKAWNEWAEGNVLEPVVGSGLRYLEALRSEVST